MNDASYYVDEFGVVNQKNPKIINYNNKYLNSYRTISFDQHRDMAALRIGLMQSVFGNPINIFDIGFGTGDFLYHACRHKAIDCYGYDIIEDLKTPEWIERIHDLNTDKPFFVTTMCDVIEHREENEFLRTLNTQFLYISVPWLSFSHHGEEFANWKHRKPNEHIKHFDDKSLKRYVESHGYKMIHVSNIEDTIRVPDNKTSRYPNILTQIFEKCP